MSNFLFDEFEAVSPAAWKQKIQVDLKGADYNENLLWQTDEGIIVKPFYTKEDRKNTIVNVPKKGFNICQSIFIGNDKIANSLAVNAIKKGATALLFKANRKFDYKKVLQDINLNTTIIYFDFDFLNADFQIEIENFCNSKNIYFQTDIIGNLAATSNWFINLKEDHFLLEKISKSIKNSIAVDASLYQNAGASITQQLAYTLAHANEYLNYFKGKCAHNIHFKFSVGSNYFFEISKLRAFRILWESLLQEYNIKNTIAHIFTQPSLRNKTLYNYNANMLRTTTECMSAILGGANTIANIAYDSIYHKTNEFGERIARNQLIILQQESFFKEAQNFADGAYYIESLTQQLAEKALIIFKQIEKSGGFLKQLKTGSIQKKINETALKEEHNLSKKELFLLGINLQSDTSKIKEKVEIYPFTKQRRIKTLIHPIIQKRLAETIEKKRLNDE